MAPLAPGSDGVPPPFPSTHLAKRLPAGALLWLAEHGRPQPVGAHPGPIGLDCRRPPASHTEARTALSSLRRPVALDRHTHPWPSMMPNSMLCCYHHYNTNSGVRRKADENVTGWILPQRQKRACFWPKRPRTILLLARVHNCPCACLISFWAPTSNTGQIAGPHRALS